jgi:hypothetical protein
MKTLLCLIKGMNPQKINASKSENMLIHLVFTHFITKPNKNNFTFLVAPNKKQFNESYNKCSKCPSPLLTQH